MATKKNHDHIDHGDHSHAPVTRSEDGTVELTFNIAWNEIESNRKATATEMGKNVTLAGFRKGNAPLEKLLKELPAGELLERTLARIIPTVLAHAIKEHNVKPAIYPKFELLHATEGEDWTVLARTCEIEEFELPKYQEVVKKAVKETPKDASIDDKQNIALNALSSTFNFKVPQLLIEEEANGRLSNLITRLEKIGLSLESYIASQKKTAPELRAEYEKGALDTIRMELALMKIAQEEKISVSEDEVQEFIKVAQLPTVDSSETENQKDMIRSMLTKRKTIEFLAALA